MAQSCTNFGVTRMRDAFRSAVVARRLALAATFIVVMSVCSTSRAQTAIDPQARTDSIASRAADQVAIDAYRRGDLDSARSAWLALLEPEGEKTDAPASEHETRSSPERERPSSSRRAGLSSEREPPGSPERERLSSSERARILYNLGNVAYRKKALLEAVGWYSAALRLSPRDPDLWWNLEHARSEAKLEPADRGDLSATLRRLVSSLTLSESEWLVLGALALWAAVLGAEAARGGRTWRRAALAGALVVVASLAPWIYNVSRAAEHPLLAIQDGKLQVKSEPRADAPAIAEVAAGEEVERLDALPEWTKVELASGVQGWAQKSALFALDR
jgi:tetratricopeptide (TPR) repeat protein